jgi:hypothetical protein
MYKPRWSTDRTSRVGAAAAWVSGVGRAVERYKNTGQPKTESEWIRFEAVMIKEGAGDRGCAVENTTSATEKQMPWSGVEERERRVYVAESGYVSWTVYTQDKG